jgi:uncharacterized protein with FMN-binding domain
MKLLLKIVLSLILIFVLAIAGGMLFMNWGLDSGSKMVIQEIAVSSLDDGTYTGKHSAGRFSNEVKVTVKDHKITRIEAVKDVMFLQPGFREELFGRVVEKQNTNLDAVSGATVTTKAYLKSIENALKK